jgi:hypothetical protein
VAVASDVDTLGTQKRDERFCDTPITTDLLQPPVGQANDVDALWRWRTPQSPCRSTRI